MIELADGPASPVLEDLADSNFDPFALDDLLYGDMDDPYPTIHALREAGPVHPFPLRSRYMTEEDQATAGTPMISIYGYDTITRALLNPELFSNTAYEFTLGLSFGRTITLLDPPEHTRYRRIFQKAFLPNVVRSWSEHLVQPVVDGLIEKFADRGRADLIADFTIHYPFQIIYKQLKLPPEHEALFQKLAVTQTAYAVYPEKAVEAGQKLGVYFEQMVRGRRDNPGNDLPSLLATAEADGERLPEWLLVSFLRQLVNAGGDTTYRGTGTLLLALLTHPEQLEAVRRDRSLILPAIEEAMRWDGPVSLIPRKIMYDTEFEGYPVKAGTLVDVATNSANRDPKHFPDPDRFDIFRKSKAKHIGFATGPHVCIGQHLARIEMERALTSLMDRFPKLRLDPDMPPPVNSGYMMRCPRELHVRFD